MKLRGSHYKKITLLIPVIILLFIIGIVIGASLEDNETGLGIDPKTIEERNLIAERTAIAVQDKIQEDYVYQIEAQNSVYFSAYDLAEIMGLEADWNSDKKILSIGDSKRAVKIDKEKAIITYGNNFDQEIDILGESEHVYLDPSKLCPAFGYEVSKLDELGIYRIKTPSRELLDIELSKLYSEEFDISIENYDEKYRIEKSIFEDKHPEYREKVEMSPIPDEDVVYFTFDDGPNEYTREILDILDDNDIKGSFFLLGRNIYGNEYIVKEIFNRGHQIGLHGMTHVYGNVYNSPRSFLDEMDRCQDMVHDILGVRSNLVRPPYGSKPGLKKEFRDLLISEGYRFWDWNVDSGDSLGISSGNSVYDTTMNQISDKSGPLVILFHDKKSTVDALPRIIDYLESREYRFDMITEDLLPLNFWGDKRY